MKDWRSTLNLPQTDFSMKANLSKKEPQFLSFWKEGYVYERMLKKNKDSPKFVLHDGPPYANGPIHIGHALNKILKDIVLKYKSLKGFRVYMKPGWDCHGLPVEHQLFKEINKDKAQVEILEFRKMAKDYALKFVNIQREDFKRLGIFADWENPYLTLDRKYEAQVLRLFSLLAQEGYIYRDLKPVNWCKSCQTALAEAEVEYYDKESPSIYILFPVKDMPAGLPSEDLYFAVWTTTPWTLLGNVACAVNPNLSYCLIEVELEGKIKKMVLARDLIHPLLDKLSLKTYKVIQDFRGRDLEGALLEHPFISRDSRVILADFVSGEEGTGIVHIAPGHGEEDFQIGKKYNLEVLVPVNDEGRFKDDDYVPQLLKGKDVYASNPLIIAILKERGLLLYEEKIVHSYPFCWRCKNPIIFRATYQYFFDVDHKDLRDKVLKAISQVRWVPSSGKERISSMVELRPHWCLSRQRLWGVPLPVFRCENCKRIIIEKEIILHLADLVEKEGSDIYFSRTEEELLPAGYSCKHCSGKSFRKQGDILDVWFESGASFYAVLMSDNNLGFPADLYLEGSDQHRGWFQVSLIPAIGIGKGPPYREVLTHGFVVDEKGRKMSKSLGNVVSPQEVVKGYGAEILRLWACFSDYHQDVKMSPHIVSQVVESYRKIRNTLRFILGNLYDFSPQDVLDYRQLLEIDKWALSRLCQILERIEGFYEDYAFFKVYQDIYKFCVVDLSNIYFDILKDRLYTLRKEGRPRRSAQSVLYYLIKFFTRVLSPILSFTAEEAFRAAKNLGLEKEDSVFLSSWIELDSVFKNEEILNKYNKLLFEFRDQVTKALEEKRQQGLIGSSLEASLVIKAPLGFYNFLRDINTNLEWIFIVSSVKLEKAETLDIIVERAQGKKCLRCWNYSTTVGNNKDFPDICQRCVLVLEDKDF